MTVFFQMYIGGFGGSKNGRKIAGKSHPRKLRQAIVATVFPQSLYLFHCGTPNYTEGDKITFAFAVTHHQNSSQE
jgi:hypothetical protein